MSTLSPHTSEAPLRADARRNRERVLDAARAEFAERGLDAQMPDIARRAGVGVGTVYRQFPTKDALVAALARAHFAALAEIAGRRVAEDAGDPWEAFAGLLWEAAERFGTDLGLAQVMSNLPDPASVAGAEIARLRDCTACLMDRAKRAGELRADATIDDVPTIMCALAKVVAVQGSASSAGWQRYLTIMLDGLRSRTP